MFRFLTGFIYKLTDFCTDLSSDLKDEPARGLKYCHNKKSQVFLVNFGQPVFKETKTFKFLMEVFSEYF
jgi:hypothetical protein